MKKWDKWIIAILFLLSFVPYIGFGAYAFTNYDRLYAVVTIGGEAYEKIPLTGQKSRKEYDIQTEYGHNLLVVENESIAIIEADCPDKICREPGFIKKPGQSLVCLPNRLYVQIEGVVNDQGEEDIKAY